MAVKLIAMDIDGTLADETFQYTARTLQTLQKAARADICLVVCTGRAYGEIKHDLAALPAMRYAVCSNGACVLDLCGPRYIVDNGIPFETAKPLLELLFSYDCLTEVCIGGKVYADAACRDNMGHFHVEQFKKILIPRFCWVENPMDVFLRHGGSVEKVNALFADMQDREEAMSRCVSMPVEMSASMYWDEYANLEFNHPTASKGAAVAALAKLLGIQKEEIMAIGDGENDVSMFETAGVSVAMGNAPVQVREKAAFVTLPNWQDGCAAAIETFALGG